MDALSALKPSYDTALCHYHYHRTLIYSIYTKKHLTPSQQQLGFVRCVAERTKFPLIIQKYIIHPWLGCAGILLERERCATIYTHWNILTHISHSLQTPTNKQRLRAASDSSSEDRFKNDYDDTCLRHYFLHAFEFVLFNGAPSLPAQVTDDHKHIILGPHTNTYTFKNVRPWFSATWISLKRI